MLFTLGIISGLLSAICYLPYIKDIFKGTTKPERASWLIWSVLGSIAFFSQLEKGATDSLWLTGVQTAGVFIVFLLSIKFGVGGLTKRDIRALIAAGIGLIIWYLTKEAATALIIVVIIDFIGSYLTAIKAYEDPGSETLSTWFLAGASGLFAVFAVGSLNAILILYPLYIFIANTMIICAIFLGRKRKLAKVLQES